MSLDCPDEIFTLFRHKSSSSGVLIATNVDAVNESIAGMSDFRGKVVLVNFWATWCSPCEREIPWFVQFQQRYEGRGFSVLGVSMDQGGWSAVKPYAARKQIDYPVVVGNEEIAALFGGLESIPLTLVIDRSGRIAAVHVGLCAKAEYEGDIAAVLNE